MVNIELLKQKIEESGYTVKYIAQSIGITRESLYNKMNRKTEFSAREIVMVTSLLKLNRDERDQIFFNEKMN